MSFKNIMFSVIKIYCILVLCLMCGINFALGISLAEELTITLGQKVTLDKFRESMMNRLPHDYMKEDIYLIKWLRAEGFDLKRPEEMLLKNIKWRKENKMDTILTEDWSDMMIEFPYHLDGYDKQGQPVYTSTIGDWDVRRSVVTGKLNRFNRHLDKILEEISVKIRDLQKEGKNVTRFILYQNTEGFNLPQHFCPQCVGRFLQFLNTLENHFPGSCDKIIVTNVSPIVEPVFQAMRTTVRPETYAAMRVFGRNRQQWEKYVLTYIDKNQIRSEYGGTKRQ